LFGGTGTPPGVISGERVDPGFQDWLLGSTRGSTHTVRELALRFAL
jgi:hypothetical protein